jgi:hypothetical protein
MSTNVDKFLASQQRYFRGSYDQFLAFGGPCVHFHNECLAAGKEAFLSQRHIEMLYATLTAWGMHRMGDSEKAKAKLTDWETFRSSFTTQGEQLQRFRSYRLLEMSEAEYSTAVLELQPYYLKLDLSVSSATIVANSKALHHLFPEFIPPIDRQYAVRFFSQSAEKWLDSTGKFKAIQLPKDLDDQFRLFHATCAEIKQLADQVDPSLLRQEREQTRISTPKALDNAIVNYVRITASELRQARLSQT